MLPGRQIFHENVSFFVFFFFFFFVFSGEKNRVKINRKMDSLRKTVIDILVILKSTQFLCELLQDLLPHEMEISLLCDRLIACIVKVKKAEKARGKNRSVKVIGILTSLTHHNECRLACKKIKSVRNDLCHTPSFSTVDDKLYESFNSRLAYSDKVLSNILQRLQKQH